MQGHLMEIRNLTVKRGNTTILENVNIIEDNNPICLTGPNGSGKTSLLLAIAKVIPAEGEVKFGGRELNQDEISFYIEGMKPYEHLTVKDYYNLVKELYNTEVKDIFGIYEKWKNTKFSKLSQGTKKKLLLELVISQPHKLLLIDEPYANLDDESKKTLASYIMKEAEKSIVILALPSKEMGNEVCRAFYDVSKWRVY
ncbi:MAG: ATP-binding cassette domain-containing protein [Acidianus infernus]|nr:ATP-binding cassette domain-containing protein [Acidianus infernus]